MALQTRSGINEAAFFVFCVKAEVFFGHKI